MRVSVANLQGIAPSRLASGTFGVSVWSPFTLPADEDPPRPNYGRAEADENIAVRGAVDTTNPVLLQKWQNASRQVLGRMLDHAYKKSTDLIVVRGLILSDDALDLLDQFSNVMTSTVISPFDPALIEAVSARASLREEKDSRWIACTVGPAGTSAAFLGRQNGSINFHVASSAIADAIPASLRLPEAKSAADLKLDFGGFGELEVSGAYAHDATLAHGRHRVRAHFDNEVERIVDFDIAADPGVASSIFETVVVRSNLDPVLDVAASEILSDTVDETIADRLRTLGAKKSPAPTTVKNMADALRGLVTGIVNRHSDDETTPVPPLIILSGKIFSAEECIYVSLKTLHNQLEAERQAMSTDRTAEIDLAMRSALERRRRLSLVIHPTLIDARDLPGGDEIGYEYAFHATLGAFDIEQATAARPRQLEMIRLLADMNEPRIQIVYRAVTQLDPVSELPGNMFYAAVRYVTQEDLDEGRMLRKKAQSLGALIHSVFRDVYSMSFGEHPPLAHRSRWIYHSGLNGERNVAVRLGPVDDKAVSPDWALFFGYTLENARPAEFEMVLSAAPSDPGAELVVDARPAAPSTDELEKYEPFRFATQDQSRRFELSAKLSASESDLDVLQFILANQFGMAPAASGSLMRLHPLPAITRFHPPFEAMPKSGPDRRSLSLSIPGVNFPATGIKLGAVTVRQSTFDRDGTARLADRDRLRHLYVLGRTGSGKTNLLKHMAEQDVAREGQGVTVIDPHGDLASHVLSKVPWNRVANDEVVSLDFSRRDFLPILNPFYRDMDPAERDRTVQTLIRLLQQRVYHEFTGPRFEELLRICFATILHRSYPDIPSLLQIPRLLTNTEYRRRVVGEINDSGVSARWKFHDSQRGDRDFASTLDWAVSKFTDLTEDETLRLTLSGGERSVDFDDILRRGKILVVALPEGIVGPETAEFIGGLIVSQLRLAAFRVGSEHLVGKGRSHFAYIDEFQKFASTDIGSLVAEGRKFGLGFVLAHQNLDQLRDFSRFSGGKESSLVSTVLANVGNVAVFRVGSPDTRTMEKQLALSEGSLIRLRPFEAVCSVLVDGNDVGPFTLSPPLVTTLANPRSSARVEMNMTMHGGEWKSIAELRRVSAHSAPGLSADKVGSESMSPLEKTDSFIDEWLARRQKMKSSHVGVSATRMVPRISKSSIVVESYGDALDDWVLKRGGSNYARGGESPGGNRSIL